MRSTRRNSSWRLHGIHAKTELKFVVATNSRHSLSVVAGVMTRRLKHEESSQLWCGDITYIATDEGWLYLGDVIDLVSSQQEESAAAHAGESGQGRIVYGVVTLSLSGRSDLPQRPQPPGIAAASS